MSGDLEHSLRTYAELAVKVALNVQPGQRLLVCDPYAWGVSLHVAPLVRAIAQSAYDAGVSFVDVIWGDEELRLMAFRSAPSHTFSSLPAWPIQGILEYFQRYDAVLILLTGNPALLNDADPRAISLAGTTLARQLQPVQEHRNRLTSNCAIISAVVPGWAAKVFPDTPPDTAEQKLWDAVFAACYVNEPDAALSWRRHVEGLRRRAEYLNSRRYQALRFSSDTTDLSVGLPEGHSWSGATGVTQRGIHFVGNMPTQEVFTLPHRERVNGVVRSTKPLPISGVIIDNFALTFENGKVVSACAANHQDTLNSILETDEGASRLGEVALVPDSSPIAQSGLVFFNALFDENAASHLALGNAWRECLQGGETMSSASFLSCGGNQSGRHVDFMIGSPRMNVDGLLATGTSEPVMRDGEWAFPL